MFNQISCILCSKKIKHTVTSASSFSRTSRVHHLVISKLEVEKYKIFKNINKTYRTDLQHLPTCKLETWKSNMPTSSSYMRISVNWNVFHGSTFEQASPKKQPKPLNTQPFCGQLSNQHKGSSPNFTFNIKEILVKQLTTIPSEIRQWSLTVITHNT